MGYGSKDEQIVQIDNTELSQDIQSNSNKIGDLSTTNYTNVAEGLNNHTAQLADEVKKQSIIKTGFIPNFIKKCLNGAAHGAWLGDSITAGGGASVTTNGYAYLTSNKIQDEYGTDVVMDNHGHGGYKTAQLLNEIVPSEITPNNYDLVVVEAGTNDWNYSTTLDQFESDYRNLIETLITQTDADIVCISLGWFNGWVSPTSNPISETEYNKIIKRICAEYKIGYIDMYNMMKNSGYAFEEITYAPDRVHPNDLGHSLWSDEAFTWFDYQGYMSENIMDNFSIDHQWADAPGITYTGNWSLEGPFASTFNQKIKSSSTSGDKLTYDFIGDKIKVYLVKDVDRGQATIKLDGNVLYQVFDLYSGTFDLHPIVIETSYGNHQLEIDVLSTKNATSSGYKCSLSKIDNYNDLNREREYIDAPYITPDNMASSPGRSMDTNSLYYFGKGVGAGALSDTVIGTVSAKAYGSKFKVIYTKYINYGIFDIYVDGVKITTIDCYAAAVSRQNIYEITGLTLDEHLIELKSTGTKNASSSGYGMVIEGILCYNAIKSFRSGGTHNTPISYQFYEVPNIQVTPTSNCTAYVSAKTERSVTVQTNPTGGTFDLRAEGY